MRAVRHLARRGSHVLGVIVIAALAAVLLVYSPSLSPLRLSPRVKSFGVAQTQVLVDAGTSPLADVYVLTEDEDTLAANLAETVGSNAVLGGIAARTGVPVRKIAVTEQLVQNVSQVEADDQEAQVGNTILGDAREYAVLVRVDPGSFVIQIFTQAPSGAAAMGLANATVASLTQLENGLTSGEHSSAKVILRQLQPATGGDVDRHIAAEAVVLFAVVFAVLGMLALIAVERVLRAAGRRPLKPTSAAA